MGENSVLHYSILDPTGNLTALVEDAVETARQPAVAAALMRRHPQVEQVGFLRRLPAGEDAQAALRMAGGEFCGNAAMSAAALLLSQRGQAAGEVRLRVSGAAAPVSLRLQAAGAGAYLAGITMPPALEICERDFAFGPLRATLPLVRMEGISHLLIGQDCAFFALLRERPAAEQAVRKLCEALGADGLGLLFLTGAGDAREMTPLVYVPGSGTCFWESACASGSAAVGMALAKKTGAATALDLREPGGTLRVLCDPAGETRLCGRVRLLARQAVPKAALWTENGENFSESC